LALLYLKTDIIQLRDETLSRVPRTIDTRGGAFIQASPRAFSIYHSIRLSHSRMHIDILGAKNYSKLNNNDRMRARAQKAQQPCGKLRERGANGEEYQT